MKYILSILFLLFVIFSSCTPKKSTSENIAEAGSVEVKANDKPKSRYDIKKELEGRFKKQGESDLRQVLPKYVEANGDGVYCYFLIKKNRVISLSLHIQYSKFDASSFELIVGDESLSYEANKTQDVTSSRMELADSSSFKWYAKLVNEEDEAIIRKIGSVKKATLRIKDASGASLATIELTQSECQALVDAVDYYIASDGAKIPKKGMVNIRSY